jgi:diaminopimelate epimerase
MRFTKMHGLGNDYVYVNGFEEAVVNPAGLARVISDRHTGVGSDGLILIQPSGVADVRMEMYNADGSRGQMCGNGIRCVAKYAVEHGLAKGPTLRIETDAGLKTAECVRNEGRMTLVRIDMGRPRFDPASLPCTIRADRIVEYSFALGDRPNRSPEPRAPALDTKCQGSARATNPELRNLGGQCGFPNSELKITCVSMGNPHAVIFVDDLQTIPLEAVGPLIETAPEFPERINAHFARVDSRKRITMKTWERGSGATRACGTGACAAAVAGALTGRTDRAVRVTLPGGDLDIEWAADDHVYMTGPAVEVFTGIWEP